MPLEDKIDPNYHRCNRSIQEEIQRQYQLALEVKKNSDDWSDKPEVFLCRSLAHRISLLLKIPELEAILDSYLEKSTDRLSLGLELVKDFFTRDLVVFESKILKILNVLRIFIAVVTEGIVSAPLDGLLDVKIDTNQDGSEHITIFVGGPVRALGGTGCGILYLISDYCRIHLGLSAYRPTEEEINRYVEEVMLYSNLKPRQRMPKPSEIECFMRNCRIMVNGNATDPQEVQNNRYLRRIPSGPRVRGGLGLLISQGIILKAPKLKTMIKTIGLDEDDFKWLDYFVEDRKKELYLKGLNAKDRKKELYQGLDTREVELQKEEDKKILKIEKEEELPRYLSKLVIGRSPISYQKTPGCLSIRIGRSRNTGLGAAGLHPVTIALFNFLTTGSQIITQKPSKALTVHTVTSCQPPTVLLENNQVISITTLEVFENRRKSIKKILYSGEILISLGEFYYSKSDLEKLDYSHDHWVLEHRDIKLPEEVNYQTWQIRNNYFKTKTLHNPYFKTFKEALDWSISNNVSLYPYYNILLDKISIENYRLLIRSLRDNSFSKEFLNLLIEIAIPFYCKNDRIYQNLEGSFEFYFGNFKTLSLEEQPQLENIKDHILDCYRSENRRLLYLNKKVWTYTKGAYTIGARIGRAESSTNGGLKPSCNGLIEVGAEINSNCTNLIKIFNSLRGKKIKFKSRISQCNYCGRASSGSIICQICYNRKELAYWCKNCKEYFIGDTKNCKVCKTTNIFKKEDNYYDLKSQLKHLQDLNIEIPENTKILNNNLKLVYFENIIKVVLRAKYNLTPFKDSTLRWTTSNATLTHFQAREIGTTVSKLKELGYLVDHEGRAIESDSQIIQLHPQDIIVNKKNLDFLFRTTKFIDELLVKNYNHKSYFNFEKPQDAIGCLVLALAPHCCSAVVGRVIGTVNSEVTLAHPGFNSAKRRDCDGDGDTNKLALDAFINHSNNFRIPHNGSLMNCPTFVTCQLKLSEVDQQILTFEVGDSYNPEVLLFNNLLKPDKMEKYFKRYKGLKTNSPISYSRDTSIIEMPYCTNNYKLLSNSLEKLDLQIKTCKTVVGSSIKDLLEIIINTHLLPDIKGGIRTFFSQEFKCKSCRVVYRAPTLTGNCMKCSTALTLTFYPNSVTKYIGLLEKLSEEYDLGQYIKSQIDSVLLETKWLFKNQKRRSLKELFKKK